MTHAIVRAASAVALAGNAVASASNQASEMVEILEDYKETRRLACIRKTETLARYQSRQSSAANARISSAERQALHEAMAADTAKKQADQRVADMEELLADAQRNVESSKKDLADKIEALEALVCPRGIKRKASIHVIAADEQDDGDAGQGPSTSAPSHIRKCPRVKAVHGAGIAT